MLISEPWGISSYGTATVHAEPDHAVLRLAVNRVANKPNESLAAATSAVGSVRQVLRTLEIPDTDVTSSRTSVHSAWDGWGPNRKFLGHQCRVEFTIRISQLDRVEAAVVQLVEAGAEEIISVEYATTQLSQLRAQARRQAIAAARSKAKLYAEAAEVGVGPVVHIEDINPEQPAVVYRGAAPSGPAGGHEGDFAPGQLTIAVAVAVGFAISH